MLLAGIVSRRAAVLRYRLREPETPFQTRWRRWTPGAVHRRTLPSPAGCCSFGARLVGARSDAQAYRAMVGALPEGVAAGDYATSAEDKPALTVTE